MGHGDFTLDSCKVKSNHGEEFMTKNLVEANQVTKREERFSRERDRGMCVFVFVFEYERIGVPVKRERDICGVVWLRMRG